MSLLLLFNSSGNDQIPEFVLKALLELGDRTSEGPLVQAVAPPWFEIVDLICRDPQGMYQIDPRAWEEIIAGAYWRAGFDEVILTPRSSDKRRDVVATKHGIGSIAPRIMEDEYIRPFIPYRLELKPRDALLPWLDELAQHDATNKILKE
jgi:Restriction endonuclease